jgi:AcrR family transcriptional regulator
MTEASLQQLTNKGNTRDRILEAALAVYGCDGNRGFTMRAAAAEVGITATAIYRHFPDKAALSHALVERARRLLGMCLLDGITGRTSLERLWSCAASYVRFARDYPQLYRLLFIDPIVDELPVVHEMQPGEEPAPFRFVVDRVREAMADGFLTAGDPQRIALSVWVHVHGVCTLALAGRLPGEALGRICEESLTCLYEGLRPGRNE